MTEQIDFRQLILDTLEERGLSRYWLAQRVDNLTPAAIYQYLRGDCDTAATNVSALLAVLEIPVGVK